MAKKTTTRYSVGYAKPPFKSRFTPGVSGNPAGRPHGALNQKTILTRILKERIVVKGPKGPEEMTRYEAMIKLLARLALSGNLHAIKMICGLTAAFEQEDEHNKPLPPTLGKSEYKMLQNLLERFPNAKGEHHV